MPGDKSISHRALLLGAIADGASEVDGFGASKDTLSTAAAVRALGAGVEVRRRPRPRRGRRAARGLGARRPARLRERRHADAAPPGDPGRPGGQFELVGDESLSSRPMERIAEPLRAMGARVETTEGHAPLIVQGGSWSRCVGAPGGERR